MTSGGPRFRGALDGLSPSEIADYQVESRLMDGASADGLDER